MKGINLEKKCVCFKNAPSIMFILKMFYLSHMGATHVA
jgi:hypothetical protein